MPELAAFEVLLSVARTGSLNATAGELGVTQQAVSARISALEAQTGVRLLVRSARGPGGGYALARPAAEMFVSEIVLAVDEPIKATRCSMTSNKLGANKRLSKDEARREIGCMPGGQRCLTHNLWEDLGVAIHDYLSQVSLEDVIRRRTRKTTPSRMEAVVS